MTTPARARYAGYRLPAEITTQASVSKTCLVRFDNNKYSVASRRGTAEARDLVRRVRQLPPSIGEVEPEAVRIAIRPIPGDHLSAIGRAPRTSGHYIAVTHSGSTPRPAAINATRSAKRNGMSQLLLATTFTTSASASSDTISSH
jgi:hypothetical protein